MKKLALLLLLVSSYGFAQEDYTNRKTALVIGNSSYITAPLRNPKNDAIAMTETLEELRFEVLSYTDISRSEMRKAIQDFGDLISERKGLGLFYYAGHGIQYQGKNYLVPVDAEIERAYQIEGEGVPLDQVLRMMEQYENPMNIVIMDACRNNPYTRSFREMNQGLAKPDNAPVGSLVAFATAPGSVASDGDGDNGLYTQELVKAMQMPGLSLEQVFKEVRKNVLIASLENQIPWESSSLRGDFYFIPPESDISLLDISINYEDCSGSLYLNCGNDIKIQAPTLGNEFNPSYLTTGATFMEGDKNGELTIIPHAPNQGWRINNYTDIPTAPNVVLTIKNNGEIIGTKSFPVRKVPIPTIEVYNNKELINLEIGLDAPGLDTLRLRIRPDEKFASQLPIDARYKIIEWQLILARGSKALKMETIKGRSYAIMSTPAIDGELDYPSYYSLAKPGDRYVIEIKKVVRLNYLNKIENVVGMRNTIFVISLN